MIVDSLAPAFSETGAVVTCNPAAGYPLSIQAQIVPVQEGEGDPSPENVRPISGWDAANLWVGGKNLFDPGKAIYNPDYWSYDEEKNEWKAEESQATFFYVVLNLKPGTYTLTAQVTELSGDIARLLVRTGDGVALAQKNFNSVGDMLLEWDCEAEGTYRIGAGGLSTGKVYIKDVMFSFGSDSPAYEPYQGQTITIPFGQNVYGGTLDWTTGVLTAKWKKIPLLSASKFSVYRETGITIPGFLDYSPVAGTGVGVCSHAPLSKDLNTPGVVYGWGSTSLYWIGVLSEIGVTTVAEFQSWLNAQSEEGTPVEMCVPTSEPITIQLTPQEILALSGVNTICADTGDVTVSGRSDPNAVIQQLAARIAALESAATQI